MRIPLKNLASIKPAFLFGASFLLLGVSAVIFAVSSSTPGRASASGTGYTETWTADEMSGAAVNYKTTYGNGVAGLVTLHRKSLSGGCFPFTSGGSAWQNTGSVNVWVVPSSSADSCTGWDGTGISSSGGSSGNIFELAGPTGVVTEWQVTGTLQ